MEAKRPSDPDYLGDWKVTSRLGEGGFGTVYLANRGVQTAAIKVIKEEFLSDPNARQRIINEALALSKLTDINIGKIVDSGLQDKVPWLATEYVNGPTLQEKVLLDSPLDELAWFNLASSLFHALKTSHAAGVIHKDIKPSNIILGETGTKLVDFGISHISGNSQAFSVSGEFEGSHAFSAPENYTGKNIPEMDVFSAAATLAFAAKGKGVWSGANPLEVMRSINDGEPDLSTLTNLQKEFLLPLFEKNPSDRPSAETVLDKANEYLDYFIRKNESERPVPITKPSKSKSNSLNKKPIVLIGTGIALLLGIAAFSFQTSNKQNVITTPQARPSAVARSATPVTSPKPISQTSKVASPSNSSKSIVCAVLVKNGRFSDAIPICQKASDQGIKDSVYNLGLAYKGVKDLPSARIQFAKCAVLKDPYCENEYGYFLSREGKTSDAIALWNDAFSKGVVESAVALGVRYHMDKNFSEAILWWEKAVDKGSLNTESYIADLYKDDLKDYDQAMIWAQRMLKDKVQGADQRIGLIYQLQGKPDLAKSYLIKCGNQGNVNCMSVLGALYYNDKDTANSTLWATRAANTGFIPAINLMARISLWLSYDMPTAKIWAQKSASKGDIEGMFTLAGLLAIVDNDQKASCMEYSQTILRATAMFSDNTYLSDTQDWLNKANDQYVKHDCKTLLGG